MGGPALGVGAQQMGQQRRRRAQAPGQAGGQTGTELVGDAPAGVGSAPQAGTR